MKRTSVKSRALSGDETMARVLLTRLNDLTDDLSDEPEAPDSFL